MVNLLIHLEYISGLDAPLLFRRTDLHQCLELDSLFGQLLVTFLYFIVVFIESLPLSGSVLVQGFKNACRVS
mgnify:FL=1